MQLLDADLRSDNGNLSAQLIADLYDVPLASVGTWIDRKKGTIWKTPDADSIQGQLQPLSDIALIRVALPGNENCRKWLRTRREMLHSKSPLEWIESGSMRDIAGFVHDALTGQPT